MSTYRLRAVPARPRLLVATLLGFSAFATLCGIQALLGFDQTAGASGIAPGQWPDSSSLHRTTGTPELLLFAHPFCPCTEATLAELARIPARRAPGSTAPRITVLLMRLPGETGGPRSPIWDKARAIPEVNVLWDEGGREAQRFGAQTSGYALLYDSRGKLVFNGGITASRGHEGDNKGLDRLISALDRPDAFRPLTAPVFGCALGGIRAQTGDGTGR